MFGVFKWPWLHGSWNPKKILTYFHRFIMTWSSLLWVRWVIPLLGRFSRGINRDMELRVMYWNGEMSGPSFLLCQIITWSLIQSRPTNQTPRWRLLIWIPNWDGGRQIPIWPGPWKTNLSDSTRYIHIGFSPQNGMVRPTVVYTNWAHNFNLARYHHHVLVMTIASKILNVSLLMSSPDS